MGNSPLTVCINQVWEKQTVQVVLPDGQVLFMPHPLTVAMLMEAHPSHFVCQGSPSLLEQRLPMDMRLESGEIYYLLPYPPVVIATTPTRDFFNNSVSTQRQQPQQQSANAKSFPLKVPYKPPPSTVVLFDKTASSQSFSDYARLSMKPQRCVINLFVFRQSVASIMPEESFRPGSPYHGDHLQQYINKPRAAPTPILSKGNPPQLDQPPKQRRGRKQVAPWKPYLESISETKAVLHDFSSSLTPSLSSINTKTGNFVNDFSLSMFSSGIKTLGASPRPSPPGSPLHNSAFPVYSYGGQQQQQQQQQPQQPQQPQRLGNLIRQGSPLHSSVLPVNSYGGQHHQQQLQQRQRFGGMMYSPIAGDRDSNRQRFIYSV